MLLKYSQILKTFSNIILYQIDFIFNNLECHEITKVTFLTLKKHFQAATIQHQQYNNASKLQQYL